MLSCLNSLFLLLMIISSCTKVENVWDKDNPFDINGDNWFPPVITPVNDTTVSQYDTVMVNVLAHDSNPDGVIEKYYWDLGSDGWDDSTDLPEYEINNPNGGNVILVWGVKDNDGLFVSDTFGVLFNRKPTSAVIGCTDQNTFWKNFNFVNNNGQLPLSITAFDPDGISDTLLFYLYLGQIEDSLTLSFTGNNTTFYADGIYCNTTYYWRLIVKDLYGDTIIRNGDFVAPVQPPRISLNKKSVTPLCFNGSDAQSDTLYIWNSGGGSLTFSCSTSCEWLNCTPASGTSTDSSDTKMVLLSYTTSNLAVGKINETVTINGLGATSEKVNVSLEVKLVPGKNWIQAVPSAPFTGRIGHSTVVFQDKLWIIGGESGGCFNDVWSSEDGINWNEATPQADFPPRAFHTSVVHDDKIWVIGGNKDYSTYYSDVWYSTDGVKWSRMASDALFGGRYGHTSVVYADKMWVIAGYKRGYGLKNDVLCSSDGSQWTYVNSYAPFSFRKGHASIVFDNKMWVIGGYDDKWNDIHNDVWYSVDGNSWIEQSELPWPLHDHKLAVYDSKLWITGGTKKMLGDGEKVVWYSESGKNWIKATDDAEFFLRIQHTCEFFKNKMWLIGGSNRWGGEGKDDIWYTGN